MAETDDKAVTMFRLASAFLGCLSLLLVISCGGRQAGAREGSPDAYYTNPIYPHGSSPYLIRHAGHYYYMQSMYDHVSIWKTDDIAELKNAPEHIIYAPGEEYYISAPRLYRFDGVWYLYFSSDGGTGAVRHIYVMENPSEDPLEGSFTMKDWIRTGNRKDIHPDIFEYRGDRYLLWSGTRSDLSSRENLWEIYIARMDTPWSICTKEIAICGPEYEWESQWVDEDGTAMPVPTLVTEAPTLIYSRDSSRLLLYYATSETFTSYYCEGLMTADYGSDVLDPASWHKCPEPVFSKSEKNGVLGPGHLSFFSAGEDLYILYNGKSRLPYMHAVDNRSPRMQPVSWGPDGIPVLGVPVREDSLLLKPKPVR